MRQAASLEHMLKQFAGPGKYFQALDDGQVRCWACGNQCVIAEGKSGICRVRFNEGGALKVPHGYVIALNADPIEKKPFYHVLPGSLTLSFGMLGCNFHCDFCQNWDISQTLKEPEAGASPRPTAAEDIVDAARKTRCRVVCSTYNEPLITSEWAVSIFQPAKAAGFLTAYVSNGYANPEIVQALRPHLDLFKIDLKTLSEKNYRCLGGKLPSVLDTIRLAHRLGYWVELVTLVVPGFNDDPDELKDIASFIKSVSPDIPWHVTAFHGQYKRVDTPATTAKALTSAAEAGYAAGLHYVYAGNVPGAVRDFENTFCPGCHETVIRRNGYIVDENRVIVEGKCPSCATAIAGVWK